MSGSGTKTQSSTTNTQRLSHPVQGALNSAVTNGQTLYNDGQLDKPDARRIRLVYGVKI